MQLNPLTSKPSLHVQLKLPSVSVQLALQLHAWSSDSHSSISVKIDRAKKTTWVKPPVQYLQMYARNKSTSQVHDCTWSAHITSRSAHSLFLVKFSVIFAWLIGVHSWSVEKHSINCHAYLSTGTFKGGLGGHGYHLPHYFLWDRVTCTHIMSNSDSCNY